MQVRIKENAMQNVKVTKKNPRRRKRMYDGEAVERDKRRQWS